MPSLRQAQLRHAVHYESVARSAESLFLKDGDAPKHGLALFDLNWDNIRLGYSWTASHWRENPDIARLCSDYLNAAPYCLDRRLSPQQRIGWLETALAAARSMNNRVAEGRHQGDLGLCYHGIGEYQKAVEFHQKRLAITRETSDRRGEAVTLNNLGNSYRSLASHESPYVQAPRGHPLSSEYIWQAIEYHNQALLIAREIGDRLEQCAAWRNLGRACMTLGLYQHAAKYLEYALLIAREINSYPEQAYALSNLAMVSKYMGRYRRSVQFYKQALAIQDKIGDLTEKGRILNSLGAAYKWRRNHRATIKCYQDKLTLAHQIGRPEQEAASFYSLGAAYWDMGDQRRAIEHYEQAICAYRDLQNYAKEADVQVSLGHAYLRSREKQKAEEAFSQAERIFHENRSPTPITLTFGYHLLSAPTMLLPLVYSLLKFLSVFFPLTSVIANVILRSVSRDKGLNNTLKQLDDLIKQDRHSPKFK